MEQDTIKVTTILPFCREMALQHRGVAKISFLSSSLALLVTKRHKI